MCSPTMGVPFIFFRVFFLLFFDKESDTFVKKGHVCCVRSFYFLGFDNPWSDSALRPRGVLHYQFHFIIYSSKKKLCSIFPTFFSKIYMHAAPMHL